MSGRLLGQEDDEKSSGQTPIQASGAETMEKVVTLAASSCYKEQANPNRKERP
jgi:hypothetical protein